MTGTDMGDTRRPDEQKRGLRRPERRAGVRIDMTPMVDIAFLLLIFYMVTTVFARPTILEIALPSKQVERRPEPVAESRLLRLYVDKYDSCYYQIGEEMEYPEMTGIDKLANIIYKKNRNVNGLVMLLKLDQESSYSSMVNLIDIIQSVEREINAEIARARKDTPGLETDNYSVRFSLENMNALDEYMLDLANIERRKKP